MPILTFKTKELNNWSNKDFVIYFAKKIKELTGNEMKIEPVAWQAFTGRIKGFRTKLNLSNQQYKTFVDTVFDDLFEQKSFAPTFGAIVSEKVYYITMKRNFSLPRTTTNFTELRDQLYSNNSLFSRVK